MPRIHRKNSEKIENGYIHGEGGQKNLFGNSGNDKFGTTNYGGSFGNSSLGDMGNSFGNIGFNGRMNSNYQNYPYKTQTKFALVLFIASIIGALIFLPIGEVIYRNLIIDANSILFMGVYFAVFGFVILLCLFIAARIHKFDFSPKGMAIAGGCILLLFLLGMFFEFLYELNFGNTQSVPDNYIFAIDNSGSMEQNDPEQKRIAAVSQLLKGKDASTQFAIYTFSDEIRCIREMGAVSEGLGDFAITSNGGTPIVGVLTQIMEDMISDALPYDEGTQIILITDGYATDNDAFGFKINRLLKKFNKKNVSISTVGLGDVDENLLTNISGKTGGYSVTTDDVDELGSVMTSVVRITDSSRNLLSARAKVNLPWLYAIMRIVFVAILGIIFTGIKIAMLDDSTNDSMLIISSVIGSVLGAIILEVGLGFILTEFFARLFMVIFISLTITTIVKIVNVSKGYGMLSKL